MIMVIGRVNKGLWSRLKWFKTRVRVRIKVTSLTTITTKSSPALTLFFSNKSLNCFSIPSCPSKYFTNGPNFSFVLSCPLSVRVRVRVRVNVKVNVRIKVRIRVKIKV
jgi:hypothetical protein